MTTKTTTKRGAKAAKGDAQAPPGEQAEARPAAARPGIDTVDVSAETLASTRGRSLALLNAVGTNDAIRLAMSQRGYTAEEHDRGWDLLHRATGYRATGFEATATTSGDAQKAMREADAWDDRTFPIAEVALRHRHPAQRAFVFDGLEAGRGAESVLRVETFLDRLDALESAPERAATRADDHAALATLAKRGVTPVERQRMRAVAKLARTYAPVDAVGASRKTGDRDARQMAQSDALKELRAWYEEWATIARQEIQRKDWLVLMGLATRKKPRRGEAE